MTATQIALFVVLALFIAAFAVLAWFDLDLATLDFDRRASQKRYRSLKRAARWCCPLAMLLAIGGIVWSPFIARDPDGGVPLAVATFIGSAIFVWLNLRWFRWSRRV